MATPTIPNGEEYFFPIIYEGNGAGQRVGKFVPFTDNGTIANSCIFNSADSPVLSRTPSGTGTSKKTFTISAWIKNGRLINSASNHSRVIYGVNHGGSSRYGIFGLYNGGSGNPDKFRLFLGKYTTGSSTTGYDWITNRTLEDTSKWYHLMAVVDTTDDTPADRVKLYIDGERVTSFASSSNPNTNDEFYFGSEYANYVSTYDGSFGEWDGYMAEVNMIDGQALLPASFGQTDTSTGRWIPSVVKPYPTTTTSIAVTVVDSGGNKYALDGVTQGTVTLIEGATYRFDQSDSSNAGHPLRFSTTSNGTHGGGTEFTSGVTTAGTPGSSGAYTEITVPVGTATLYYYCTNHSGMGGTANTQDQYGTNGFRLKFQDSSALGNDTSGNTNDFSVSNIVAGDQTTDSPTQNFAVIGENGFSSLSKGNLKAEGSVSGQWRSGVSSLGMKSGKYYWEVKIVAHSNDNFFMFGICNESTISYVTAAANRYPGLDTNSGSYSWQPNAAGNDDIRFNGSIVREETGTPLANDNILQFAYDADTDRLWVGKDDTFLYSGDPANGTNYTISGIGTSETRYPALAIHNDTSHKFEVNFGQKSFAYTPPTGFVALQQDNLPETAKGVSGLVWTKNRDSTDNHQVYDSSRGKQLVFASNTTTASTTVTDGLQKFLAGGQQIEDNVAINTSGESYVSWNWVANGSTTASNTDGSITSTVQANTTAGFSIVEYTGNGGNAAATIGHGLSSAPEWMMVKFKDSVAAWSVYHKSVGATKRLQLNSTTTPLTDANIFNNTEPTPTVFSVGSSLNQTTVFNFIVYCWHEVEGFSKFGSYTGTTSSDGPFIYTGFSPSWVMIKRISASGEWFILDKARNPNNTGTKVYLDADTSDVEGTLDAGALDWLSNGFKLRQNSSQINNGTHIYMAFAEHPFVGDGTNPVTAR
jgi:hypothetical protein